MITDSFQYLILTNSLNFLNEYFMRDFRDMYTFKKAPYRILTSGPAYTRLMDPDLDVEASESIVPLLNKEWT